MSEYLLIFRDHERQWEQFSPAQMQAVADRFETWRLSLGDAFIAAGKLTQELGTTVRKQDQEFVVDGPFCEAKEAIAGFYLVRADSQKHAETLAMHFPMLDYGGSVEVRAMAIAILGT